LQSKEGRPRGRVGQECLDSNLRTSLRRRVLYPGWVGHTGARVAV